jgi:hypothetical protein
MLECLATLSPVELLRSLLFAKKVFGFFRACMSWFRAEHACVSKAWDRFKVDGRLLGRTLLLQAIGKRAGHTSMISPTNCRGFASKHLKNTGKCT